MYIQLWTGLRDLYHDNKTTTSMDNAKRFINWSLRDIGNEYDWEFLRDEVQVTPTADIEYNLNRITQPTGCSANIFGIASAAADNGTIAQVYGAVVNNVLNTIAYQSTNLELSAAVSASGTVSDIQYISKPETTGTVYFSDGTRIIATMSPNETYISNDIRKVNKVVDVNGNTVVTQIDWATQADGSPDGTTVLQGYDFVGSSRIRFFGARGTYNIIYQKKPRWLINNTDRTEFPEELHQDIVQYAYRVYGKQYQDEATQVPDQQIDDLKKMLIGNIIRKWSNSGDKKNIRVTPRGYARAV
jgi:hypothetical protein